MKTMLSKVLNGFIACIAFTWILSITQSESLMAQCNGIIQIQHTIIQPCANDGQIVLQVSGGVAPYQYQWASAYDAAFNANTKDINNLKPGYYSVTVTDAINNCGVINYLGLNAPFLVNTITTPADCPLNNGTAEVTNISGGAIPYSYLWSTGATTEKIENLAAGSYQLTVSDANGCFLFLDGSNNQKDSMSELTVQQKSDITLMITAKDAECTILSGEIDATVESGGLPPYVYAWENYFTQQTWNTQKIINVASGYYMVTVTDANGCYAISGSELGKKQSFNVTLASTQENCQNSDGTASVTASGGSAPYQYQWSNGLNIQQITGLTGGNYTITVTDANGCEENGYVNVYNYSPIQPNIIIQNETCHDGQGSISCTPTLGTAPFTYFWSNGSTTSSISNLSQGNYYVTITDQVGCKRIQYAFVSNMASFEIIATSEPEKCNGAKGKATVSVNGGVPPFTYQWNNGETTSQITNLSNGYYYCTITDATGCTSVAYNYVSLDNQLNAYAYSNPEICESKNGIATIWASGVNNPISFKWNTGAQTSIINALSSGTYTVTITDALGCSVVKQTFVNRTSGDFQVSVSTLPATCIFEADGQAVANVTGGTPPYSYQWGNGSTGNTTSGLVSYFGIGVIAKDSKGCVDQDYSPSVGYVSLDCAALIKGTVYNDANENCTPDIGEQGIENVFITCMPNVQYATTTDDFGNYHFYVPKDQQYLITQTEEYKGQICPTGSIITPVTTAAQVYEFNDFFDKPLDVNDLKVSMNYYEPARPGFTHKLIVHVLNAGLHKANGNVILDYDAAVQYVTGGSSVDQVNRKVTFNFTDLLPFTGSIQFEVVFQTPATSLAGEQQKYIAHVYPDLNDASFVDNEENLILTVVNSYDPNEKSISFPDGLASDCFTEKDSILKYTVRFQNTGNYPASFVVIKDKLDDDLDIATLRTGSASHPFRIQFLPDQSLAFLFDPIYLPDSTRDEKGSHGFVTFYIKPKKDLVKNTVIKNKAEIYFDFNKPIITNSVQVIKCFSSATEEEHSQDAVRISPNPVIDQLHLDISFSKHFTGTLEVVDLIGRIVYQEHMDYAAGEISNILPIQHLTPGSYFIRFIGDRILDGKTFIKL